MVLSFLGVITVLLCFNNVPLQTGNEKSNAMAQNTNKVDTNKRLYEALCRPEFYIAFINNSMTVGTGLLLGSLYQSHGYRLD